MVNLEDIFYPYRPNLKELHIKNNILEKQSILEKSKEESYRLKERFVFESDMIDLENSIDNNLDVLSADFEKFKDDFTSKSLSNIELLSVSESLVERENKLHDEIEKYILYLESLQNNENYNNQKVLIFKQDMHTIFRYVEKHSIPGYTEKVTADTKEIEELISILEDELAKKKLDLVEIERLSENIEYLIHEKYSIDIEKMVEKAQIAEELIKKLYLEYVHGNSEVEELMTSAETSYLNKKYAQSMGYSRDAIKKEFQDSNKIIKEIVMKVIDRFDGLYLYSEKDYEPKEDSDIQNLDQVLKMM